MNRTLFVDDDLNSLKATQRRLRKTFDLDIAQGGKEGLAAIAVTGPYAVIVSDLMMPGMDGFQFIQKAGKIAPHSVFIMLTAHANLDASLKALNEGNIFRFLTKPCKMHVLEKAIQAAIEQYHKNLQIVRAPGPGAADRHRSTVLVVDDDVETLGVFSAALKTTGQFDVLTAENGQVALTIVDLIKTDMVVADRDMPKMDGVTLLSSIRQRDPDSVLFLMTWQRTPELARQLTELCLGGIFEKPLDMPLIVETIGKTLHSSPRGQIDGISTAAFLQMIEMEEKTCTLQVRSAERRGLLFFEKGQLIAAKAHGLENETAAHEIINWKEAAISMEEADMRQEPQINRPLIQILMEAARKQDERKMMDG